MVKMAVVCGSQKAIDGWTGKELGWLYGFHFINRMPADRRCPRCGLPLGEKERVDG